MTVGRRSVITALLLCLAFSSAFLAGDEDKDLAVASEEAAFIVDAFRHQRLSGDFVFEFELEFIPRRGKESHFRGRLWGTWASGTPRFRVILQPYGKNVDESTVEILMWAGSNPYAWHFDAEGYSQSLDVHRMDEPIIEGTTLSASDLMLSFVYWDKWEYVKEERVRGHRAHLIEFFSPFNAAGRNDRVRAIIHAKYNALIGADFYNSENEITKKFDVQSFKKVGDEWLIKMMDYRNKISGDKTRFTVLRAAVGLKLPFAYFEPSWTGMPPDVPPTLMKPVK